MSLFLSWEVGSFRSTLYVLVSCSNAWAFVGVVLLVHDDHGHPLVFCKNHPGVVLFRVLLGLCIVEG